MFKQYSAILVYTHSVTNYHKRGIWNFKQNMRKLRDYDRQKTVDRIKFVFYDHFVVRQTGGWHQYGTM